MSELEEQDISQIVEVGLEKILSGQSSMEDILFQYPDKAELLRPEFEIAMWLVSRSDQVKPRPGYVRASRKRIVDQIKQESKSRATKPALFGFNWPKRLAFQAMLTLVLLMIFALTSTGIVSASNSSIPGDRLYPVKRFSERVEYQIAFGPETRVDLSIRFAGRRLSEADALMRLGRMAEARLSLLEYQQEIGRAVEQLQMVSDKNIARKAQLAAALQANLATHAVQINQMMTSAPVDIQRDLQQALASSDAGAVVVDDVVIKMETLQTGTTATPEPALTGTNPAPTDTSAPTDITVPIMTLEPGVGPVTGTLAIDVTLAPEQIQSTLSPYSPSRLTPTVTPKIDRTPKPTHPNWPGIKPAKPTDRLKPDKPGGGSGSSPPVIATKPDKSK